MAHRRVSTSLPASMPTRFIAARTACERSSPSARTGGGSQFSILAKKTLKMKILNFNKFHKFSKTKNDFKSLHQLFLVKQRNLFFQRTRPGGLVAMFSRSFIIVLSRYLSPIQLDMVVIKFDFTFCPQAPIGPNGLFAPPLP